MKTWLLALGLLGALVGRVEAEADRRPTVAVLYFDYTGKDEGLVVLKKGLAQMLISDLSVLDGVRIVERDRLEAILAEQKLGASGKVDPATATKIGKLLGAKYLVLGGYFDLMGMLRADARVVEVETGRVVQSVGAGGKPGEFIELEQKLSGELGGVLKTALKSFAAATAKESSQAKAKPEPQPESQPVQHFAAAPKALKTKTAVRYSAALDALDKGNKTLAKKELQEVVKEQPDFKLAALDLDKLAQ